MGNTTAHKPAILTIGHSNRTLPAFLDLLRVHSVKRLVDVRTVPRSRHNPQFNRETLPQPLQENGIGYTHQPELGGLRHAQQDSPNMGWRNASFRGYADYMQTAAFEIGLEVLIETATRERAVIMCAEAVPWRCHRSLIADALTVRGHSVEHITGAARTLSHSLTPFAKVSGTHITYPPVEGPQSLLPYEDETQSTPDPELYKRRYGMPRKMSTIKPPDSSQATKAEDKLAYEMWLSKKVKHGPAKERLAAEGLLLQELQGQGPTKRLAKPTVRKKTSK